VVRTVDGIVVAGGETETGRGDGVEGGVDLML
jgi:hypothetical protein